MKGLTSFNYSFAYFVSAESSHSEVPGCVVSACAGTGLRRRCVQLTTLTRSPTPNTHANPTPTPTPLQCPLDFASCPIDVTHLLLILNLIDTLCVISEGSQRKSLECSLSERNRENRTPFTRISRLMQRKAFDRRRKKSRQYAYKLFIVTNMLAGMHWNRRSSQLMSHASCPEWSSDPDVCPESEPAQVVAYAMGDAAYSKLIRYAFRIVDINPFQYHPLVSLPLFTHCGHPSPTCACHAPDHCTGMQHQDRHEAQELPPLLLAIPCKRDLQPPPMYGLRPRKSRQALREPATVIEYER
jgi:hypothetical protein